MNTMNPEVKAKWLAALRSGEYKQTTFGELRSEDGAAFCCLGVLCDVHRKETNKGNWQDAEPTSAYGQSYLGAKIYLPVQVAEWAGLNNVAPHVKWKDHPEPQNIADVNDDGTPFTVIADLIEEQF